MERLDYNLLYRNSRNEDSSEYESECEESEYEESINDKQNLKYGKTIFNFFIDSCDRNWFTTIKQRECFDTEGKISRWMYFDKQNTLTTLFQELGRVGQAMQEKSEM